MSKPLKKLITTVCFAVSAILIFSILSTTTLADPLQTKLQRNLYNEQQISDDIVIVYIDDNSFASESLGRWQDWSREYYANVIEKLNRADAKVIGIDLVFNTKSEGISENQLIEVFSENNPLETIETYLDEENHPDDIVLAEAFEEAGNVILVKFPYIEDGEILTEVGSLDFIAESSADEGYSHSELSQSEIIYKTYAKESFAKKIAEYFSEKEFEIPTDEANEMYINYAGSAKSYQNFSFVDIYTGLFDQDAIEGKIVLIGVGSPGMQDRYTTPIGEELMYGIEIHANAIQTILDQNFLREATPTQQALILTVLAALATALFMYLGIWWTIPALIALAAAYHATSILAFNQGLILNLIYPYLALLTLYLTSTIYRYITELKEKKQVKSAFGHYVSKDVVAEILKNPENLKLGGERRQITTFFSDIANFTGWSEGVEPEDLVAQLNEYLDATSALIMKNQGTVDKFEGDAVMAFWNAPLEVKNHAALACQTALEIRNAISQLNRKWKQEGKRELSFRIGINTGEAIIGNIGSSERFDYTAIGDDVNLSARLESANKFYGTQIMISGNTQSELADQFELRRLDRIRVKGKEEPIDIFELLAPKGQLPEEALNIINIFHQAIEYYRNANWAEAKARFEEVLAKTPNDNPSKTYLERLEELSKNPPENWDGVWTFNSK